MLTITMLLLLVAFILLGAPIGFVMVILPTAYILITDAVPLASVPYQMYTALNKFPLVAVPLFLLAGELMNVGAVTARLLEFSRELVGRFRGGLAHITIVLSLLFASLNGSAVASTATIGGIMIPAMKKAGYSPSFSAATTAVSSTIGGIIPPSIAMVIFASTANLSIGKLFSAGILPGIAIGLMFIGVAYVISVRRGYERYEVPFDIVVLAKVFVRSLLALSLPLILYFGIVAGVFTATEAGAVVCFLAFVIGKYVYGALTWQGLWQAVGRTVRLTASIFLIIAAAGPFSWLLTRLGALQGLEQWLVTVGSDSTLMFILAFLVVIFVAGMIMDVVANLIILGPVLLSAALLVGVSETQAAMVIIVGFLIGTVTPPVGICYFTAARIAEERLEPVAKAMLPFIAAEVALLVIIILFEPLTGLVPRLAGFETI